MGISILLFLGIKFLSGSSVLSNGEILERASEINKTLPRRIDTGLYWDRASAEDRQFKFYYSLADLSKQQIDIESFKSRQRQVLQQFSCSDKQSRGLLEGLAFIHYIYRDKDGETIAKVLISPADCGLTLK